MKSNYQDILDRIPEEPKWHDQNGVPRYDKFHPGLCPDIYSNQVILLKISCQACCREFQVEIHGNWYAPIRQPNKLHYGDPPRHGCVGDSMNCEDLEVLQAWCRDASFATDDWKRMPELEGPIDGCLP